MFLKTLDEKIDGKRFFWTFHEKMCFPGTAVLKSTDPQRYQVLIYCFQKMILSRWMPCPHATMLKMSVLQTKCAVKKCKVSRKAVQFAKISVLWRMCKYYKSPVLLSLCQPATQLGNVLEINGLIGVNPLILCESQHTSDFCFMQDTFQLH